MAGRGWLAAVAAAALLAGCAATQTRELQQAPPAELPRRAELAAVPFFPQERYQCGPAALAMALAAAAIATTPEALVPEVYLPERQGSLAPEMLAAGRRHGAVSLRVAPRLEALLAEVAAGSPVVVLQNLGLSWAPRWHYAVVVGYDLEAGDVILRSGLDARQALPMSTFEHTWARSGYWGMVALAPGRLPKRVEEAEAVRALVAFEAGNPPENRRRAFEAAAARWPDNLTLLLGLGNARHALGDVAGAAEAYAQAARRHPEAAAAHNNLAVALAELGRYDEARAAVLRALTLGGAFREAAEDTLRQIEARQRGRR